MVAERLYHQVWDAVSWPARPWMLVARLDELGLGGSFREAVRRMPLRDYADVREVLKQVGASRDL